MATTLLTLRIDRPAAGVCRLSMNRRDIFNAFDEVMIAELDAAFAELADDDDVRVIALAGEGRHFSAGADLNWMRRERVGLRMEPR